MVLINFQALFEILMILCISFRLRQQGIRLTRKIVIMIFGDLVVINLVNIQYLDEIYVNAIYVMLLVFLRFQFDEKFSSTCYYFAITLLICGIWQLAAYYPFACIMNAIGYDNSTGTVVNCAGVLATFCFKKWGIIFKKENLTFLKENKGVLVLGVFTTGLLFLTIGFKEDLYFNDIESLAILLFCISLSVTIWQWNSRLQVIKYREKEIELLKNYNTAYSQLVDAVRMKQHDFHNDLNAMLGIAYSAENRDEILKRQQELCDCIIENGKHSKLLNNMNPIITGMLFVKVLQGEKQGCIIDYRVSCQQMDLKMNMMDVVELIGILFDNAIEEEQKYESNKRYIYFELLDRENGEYFLIRNRIEQNLSIEKISRMFDKGKSDKGEGRGIGLYKVNRIIKKYELDFGVEQTEYMNDSYISFKITLT